MDIDIAIALAAQRMDLATSGFCLTPYAEEGLRALIEEGWQIIPPPSAEQGEQT